MHDFDNVFRMKIRDPHRKWLMTDSLMCCDENVYPPGTSALYKPGNNIVCIFENPENEEIKRGMPVVGQTGAHLGLLMYLCSAKEELRRIGFDASNVTIVNARREKLRKPDDAYVHFMCEALRDKRIIICFGRSAESFLEDMIRESLDIRTKCVIRTVHLAHNGLNFIKRKDGKSASDVLKIGAIADFLCSVEVVAGHDYGDEAFNGLKNWVVRRNNRR